MGWREKGRAAAENVRALEVERQTVRESAAQLKTEMTEVASRMKLSGEEHLRVMQMWFALESPSDGARTEYALLTKEIHDLRKEYFDLLTLRDDELHEVTLAILAAPKTRYSQRLSLTAQMNEILRGKLVNDMPRCRDTASLREHTVQRMIDLVERESK